MNGLFSPSLAARTGTVALASSNLVSCPVLCVLKLPASNGSWRQHAPFRSGLQPTFVPFDAMPGAFVDAVFFSVGRAMRCATPGVRGAGASWSWTLGAPTGLWGARAMNNAWTTTLMGRCAQGTAAPGS